MGLRVHNYKQQFLHTHVDNKMMTVSSDNIIIIIEKFPTNLTKLKPKWLNIFFSVHFSKRNIYKIKITKIIGVEKKIQ